MAKLPVAKEVFFETTRHGSYMKVTAIEPQSLIEVSVQGPRNAAESDLKKLAMDKLNRELAKQNQTNPRVN